MENGVDGATCAVVHIHEKISDTMSDTAIDVLLR